MAVELPYSDPADITLLSIIEPWSDPGSVDTQISPRPYEFKIPVAGLGWVDAVFIAL
jgi:hypothetical protein